MPKIPMVGGSYQERSLWFDAQRTINLYPVQDKEGQDVSALYGTAGLSLFNTIGVGEAYRGNYSCANGRAFAVVGGGFYEILSNGTSVAIGSLLSNTGAVSIVENGFQLAICDKSSVYIYTFATGAFTKVVDVDLPSTGFIDFIDGYFVATKNNSGQFYISALYDGLNWDALDFASAESSPDKLNCAVNFLGQLALFGDQTYELWRNTGDSTFPFTRISGTTAVGCVAPFTVANLGTFICWVGNNRQGGTAVYIASGFNPTRISTSPIERLLESLTNPQNLRAWTYQEEGHLFYVLTGAELPTSFVYDFSTKLWHERAYLNSNGILEQHLGICFMRAFNKNLVGDRTNGNLYQLSQDVFTDNGQYIKRVRVYTHLVDKLKYVRYRNLLIGFETGTALQSGQGSSPLASLRISSDGAKTWSAAYTKSIGRVGDFQTEVNFRRLGLRKLNTFELSISEPIKIAITGSYLN